MSRHSNNEPLSKGRRQQGCQKVMANPEGIPFRAKAGEPYQNLDGGRFLPGINYIPLPMIGEGLGEWFEAPSYEEGGGCDGSTEGLPSDGLRDGYSACYQRTFPLKKQKIWV